MWNCRLAYLFRSVLAFVWGARKGVKWSCIVSVSYSTTATFPLHFRFILVAIFRIGLSKMDRRRHKTFRRSGSSCFARVSARTQQPASLCTVWLGSAGKSVVSFSPSGAIHSVRPRALARGAHTVGLRSADDARDSILFARLPCPPSGFRHCSSGYWLLFFPRVTVGKCHYLRKN